MSTNTTENHDRRMHKAVDTVGREVLLVRDGKVIGTGYSKAMVDGIVSIEMRDDNAKKLVENSSQVQAWSKLCPEKQYKYSLFKFCSFTGCYLDYDEDFHAELEEVRVVDKSNLRYGMVPDTFKDVEGYHAIAEQSN